MSCLVSIILPTYNRSGVIGNAIQSVLAQDYTDFELLIVDDGSNDNTEETVGRINDSRIKYIRCENNRGQSHARNIGIDEAKGDYIAFIDSDNEWMNSHLSRKMDILKYKGELTMAFGKMNRYEDGEFVDEFPQDLLVDDVEQREKLIHMMCLENRIDTNTVVLSKKCFIEHRFEESMSALEDWNLFFDIVCDKRIKVFFDPEPTVLYVKSKDSIGGKKERYLKNRLRIVKGHKESFEKLNCSEWTIDKYYISEVSESVLQEAVEQVPESLHPELISFLTSACINRNKDCQELKNSLQDNMANLEMAREGESNAVSNWKAYHIILDIDKILKAKGYNEIAIYGYGNFGKYLCQQLERCGKSVYCVIDKKAEDGEKNGIRFLRAVDDTVCADVLIVAILHGAEEIAAELRAQTKVPVYSLLNLRNEI